MTATSRLITLGVVVSISNTFSCVTLAWELRAGWLMLGRHAKISSSILVTEFLPGASIVRATLSALCWALSPYVTRFLARALRRTFLAELAGSLAAARSKSTSALPSREKVSISPRQLVIQMPRHGQSARLAVGWKSA